MPDLTFVIPVGVGHEAIVSRALASVDAQTVPCNRVVVYDTERHGAGWARNRGLARVETPFVSFLDADDWLDERFAERCLQAWRGDRYIYTDWEQDNEVKHAPDCPWYMGTWHVITALLPTAWVRTVGGFDETLGGGEDTALYAALTWNGYCGRRLPEPLFHYSPDGRRSKAFFETPAHHALMQRLTEQYRGRTMSCCGDNVPVMEMPVGEQLSGDVLAVAQWGGNRQERGRVTGRLYPRTGNGKQAWVDPRDAEAAPHLWRRVQAAPILAPVALEPQADDFRLAVAMLVPTLDPDMQALAQRMGVRVPTPPPVVPVPEGSSSKPDVAALVAKARKAFNG